MEANKEKITGGLYGEIVRDALGVPVEFCQRRNLSLKPVTDMIRYDWLWIAQSTSWNPALWYCESTDNFKDAVLKAVNLGDETDTIGTVTGALAGTNIWARCYPLRMDLVFG